MANALDKHAREKMFTKCDNGFYLWCPFCDLDDDECWRLTDSIVSRKKLGMHIVNKHPNEVRFAQGTKPPEYEEGS